MTKHCVACGQVAFAKTESEKLYRAICLEIIEVWHDHANDKDALASFMARFAETAMIAEDIENSENQQKLNL